MSKFLLFATLLSIVPVASAGVFINSGSASIPCFGPSGNITEAATGTTIDLSCPPGDVGPNVEGSASNLATQGTVPSGLPFPGPGAKFSFQSTFLDTMVPTGGIGAGVVEFTIDYEWTDFGDLAGGTAAADFAFAGPFGGGTEWSQSNSTCIIPEEHFLCLQTYDVSVTIDEPIVYGEEFTYQADTSAIGGGQELGFVSNSMVISAALLSGGELIDVPEPGNLCLCAVTFLGSLVLIFRRGCDE